MGKVDDILKEIKEHVEDAVFTAIVNLDDGTPVAGQTFQEDFDIEVPIAFFSDVARRSMKASRETGFGNLEDAVLTTEEQFVIMRILPGEEYVHLLSIGRNGNWGIAKVAMQRYAQRLRDSLP